MAVNLAADDDGLVDSTLTGHVERVDRDEDADYVPGLPPNLFCQLHTRAAACRDCDVAGDLRSRRRPATSQARHTTQTTAKLPT
jgi:hypothetical protein